MGYWTEGNGRRIGVLGLGRSGRAAAKLLRSRGFIVTGIDSNRNIEPCEWCDEIHHENGNHDVVHNLEGLVLSPGVKLESVIPAAARSAGLPLIGEIELASLYAAAPILAVTGSNGKTTTVEWLGYLLRQAGRNACVAGNMGFPFSSAVLDHPDAEFYVVEVSSYQLETVETFRPLAAAILNITPDHLQRHGSMEKYTKAKARIFMNQHSEDVLILNAEDPGLLLLHGYFRGVLALFSRTEEVKHGADGVTDTVTLCIDGERIPVIGKSDISLPGRHNLSNALAVACLAMAAGIDPCDMASGLSGFRGVPHRIESIRVIHGVEYVNDSKSTNRDSLKVALESFNRPVVLLAGGISKESDYSVLRDLISEKAVSIVLFGEAADELAEAWQDTVPIYLEKSLPLAMGKAKEIATSGQVILLSPGCASFDQYRSFEERGDHFRAIVGGIE